jgi:site-specific DNA-methyltransferase (adenine-specific)/adenine-specific DNA-methyltransferase
MPSLSWIANDAVADHHRQVPYHLLRCAEKLSVGDPGSRNLLVQGDNRRIADWPVVLPGRVQGIP